MHVFETLKQHDDCFEKHELRLKAINDLAQSSKDRLDVGAAAGAVWSAVWGAFSGAIISVVAAWLIKHFVG